MGRYRKRGYKKGGKRRKTLLGYMSKRLTGRSVPVIHRFKETCELTQWSCAAGSTQFGIQTFKLNDLFNAGQFKNLFDLYKITGVKLTIIPRFNQASVGEASNGPVVNSLPMLYIAPNRSPWSTAPTSVQDILNDDGIKIVPLDRKYSFYLSSPSPRLLDGAANGVPVQLDKKTKPWLTTGGNSQDVDQSGVEYYSHRWAISNIGSSGIYTDVYATYYLTFKEQN